MNKLFTVLTVLAACLFLQKETRGEAVDRSRYFETLGKYKDIFDDVSQDEKYFSEIQIHEKANHLIQLAHGDRAYLPGIGDFKKLSQISDVDKRLLDTQTPSKPIHELPNLVMKKLYQQEAVKIYTQVRTKYLPLPDDETATKKGEKKRSYAYQDGDINNSNIRNIIRKDLDAYYFLFKVGDKVSFKLKNKRFSGHISQITASAVFLSYTSCNLIDMEDELKVHFDQKVNKNMKFTMEQRIFNFFKMKIDEKYETALLQYLQNCYLPRIDVPTSSFTLRKTELWETKEDFQNRVKKYILACYQGVILKQTQAIEELKEQILQEVEKAQDINPEIARSLEINTRLYLKDVRGERILLDEDNREVANHVVGPCLETYTFEYNYSTHKLLTLFEEIPTLSDSNKTKMFLDVVNHLLHYKQSYRIEHNEELFFPQYKQKFLQELSRLWKLEEGRTNCYHRMPAYLNSDPSPSWEDVGRFTWRNVKPGVYIVVGVYHLEKDPVWTYQHFLWCEKIQLTEEKTAVFFNHKNFK